MIISNFAQALATFVLKLSEDTKHVMVSLSKDGLSASDFLGVMA